MARPASLYTTTHGRFAAFCLQKPYIRTGLTGGDLRHFHPMTLGWLGRILGGNAPRRLRAGTPQRTNRQYSDEDFHERQSQDRLLGARLALTAFPLLWSASAAVAGQYDGSRDMVVQL
jgi:hypothetical protein